MKPHRHFSLTLLLAAAVTTTWPSGVPSLCAAAADAPAASPQPPPEPPAPKPSEAVQKLLDEANRLAGAKQFAEGLQQVDRALATSRESKDVAGEAWAQRGRAILLDALGRTAEAVVAWREAAAVWVRAGDGPGQVEALAAAALQLTTEKPAQAEALIARAIALGREEAKRPLAVAEELHTAGLACYDQGLLAQAREFLSAALSVFAKLAPNSLDVARSLNSLGNVTSQHGDLAGAREYYRRALAIVEKLAPNSLDVAKSLNNLGIVAGDQGDLVGAREYYQRALAIRENLAPNSLDMAGSLTSLGLVAGSQGDLAGAGEYHRRALAIQEKLAPNSLDVAKSLHNLGIVAASRGDLAGARGYFQRALAIGDKLAPNSLDVAGSLNNLGNVADDQGDLAGAREYYRRALAIVEKLAPNSLDMAGSLGNLGDLAGNGNDWVLAEAHYHRAWGIVRQQTGAVTGDEARQAFGTSTAIYAANLIRAQTALRKRGSAFITLEESRAQALLQLLLERRLPTSAERTPLGVGYRAAVAERDRAEQVVSQSSVAEALARRSLAEAREAGATAEEVARRQAAGEAAWQEFAAAEAAYTRARLRADGALEKIKRGHPRLFAPPLTLAEARRSLPPEMLFVAFSVGAEQTHLFLLSSSRHSGSALSVYLIPVKARELQSFVHALERTIQDSSSDPAEVAATSRALFARLFPPKAWEQVRNAKRLLISPDGVLWEVPFAALVTNASGPPRYLGEQKPITYTSSLTLFARTRQDRPPRADSAHLKTLVVGDPLFDRSQLRVAKASPSAPLTRGELEFLYRSGPPPPRLPATRGEALAVAGCYRAAPLLGEQATETAVRQRMPQADVIHLATHGIVHRYRAMSSGVLLTVPAIPPPPNDAAHDGFLQAWEIASQLPLKADLVVLSACSTGRGENVASEGIVGLTRALQTAGARSIVASQWRVDDQSTARLMVAFHRKLRQGLAKDEALRQAMAAVRKEPRTAKPYFWAPFFLVGDPDNRTLGASAQARRSAWPHGGSVRQRSPRAAHLLTRKAGVGQ